MNVNQFLMSVPSEIRHSEKKGKKEICHAGHIY